MSSSRFDSPKSRYGNTSYTVEPKSDILTDRDNQFGI
jgi:hypothetical protein